MRTRFIGVFLMGLLALAEAPLDPWKSHDVLETAELAKTLQSGSGPAIFMVGPRILYNGDHIKGAAFAGPAGNAAGLTLLREQTARLPKDTAIVIYCGCCPMEHCPNIRPAFAALRDAGFQNVKVLRIPTNLVTDWTNRGYPVEKGAIAK